MIQSLRAVREEEMQTTVRVSLWDEIVMAMTVVSLWRYILWRWWLIASADDACRQKRCWAEIFLQNDVMVVEFLKALLDCATWDKKWVRWQKI
jgi:hypothetical protein